MKLFNSLTKEKEDFVPLSGDKKVGVYTCGPTVYDYVTIGNWRTYTLGDFLVRALKYEGYEVDYIMNITDVGHLTGDNEGDASLGEDRLEKGAAREGKSAWDIAKFYTEDFYTGFEALNLTKPRVFAVATDHIKEQIELVKTIQAKGYVYEIAYDGLYFDVSKYESDGHEYGQLSNIDQVKEGARVKVNPHKKDPRDFALWKFSPKDTKRHMEWESPWGVGFPGWHIECSAMGMKYLGEQFDIHVGGEDLRSTHHPNEIAQSEAATGKEPFVKYWLHGAFLQVDGGRMGKSLGNAYKLQDLGEKGYTPLDLRYFYLTGHYRKKLNFTWESLDAARSGLKNLRAQVKAAQTQTERTALSEEKNEKVDTFRSNFQAALDDDLNMPQALAVAWEVVKSNIPSEDKYDLVRNFDEVLGLDLTGEGVRAEIPAHIQALAEKRETLRNEKKFEEADKVRDEIASLGYEVKDSDTGPIVEKSS